MTTDSSSPAAWARCRGTTATTGGAVGRIYGQHDGPLAVDLWGGSCAVVSGKQPAAGPLHQQDRSSSLPAAVGGRGQLHGSADSAGAGRPTPSGNGGSMSVSKSGRPISASLVVRNQHASGSGPLRPTSAPHATTSSPPAAAALKADGAGHSTGRQLLGSSPQPVRPSGAATTGRPAPGSIGNSNSSHSPNSNAGARTVLSSRRPASAGAATGSATAAAAAAALTSPPLLDGRRRPMSTGRMARTRRTLSGRTAPEPPQQQQPEILSHLFEHLKSAKSQPQLSRRGLVAEPPAYPAPLRSRSLPSGSTLLPDHSAAASGSSRPAPPSSPSPPPLLQSFPGGRGAAAGAGINAIKAALAAAAAASTPTRQQPPATPTPAPANPPPSAIPPGPAGPSTSALANEVEVVRASPPPKCKAMLQPQGSKEAAGSCTPTAAPAAPTPPPPLDTPSTQPSPPTKTPSKTAIAPVQLPEAAASSSEPSASTAAAAGEKAAVAAVTEPAAARPAASSPHSPTVRSPESYRTLKVDIPQPFPAPGAVCQLHEGTKQQQQQQERERERAARGSPSQPSPAQARPLPAAAAQLPPGFRPDASTQPLYDLLAEATDLAQDWGIDSTWIGRVLLQPSP